MPMGCIVADTDTSRILVAGFKEDRDCNFEIYYL